jgi:hypothetical protein
VKKKATRGDGGSGSSSRVALGFTEAAVPQTAPASFTSSPTLTSQETRAGSKLPFG